MSSFEFLLLFASILASGSLIFLIKRIPPNTLKLLLSFSGAYLFALSLLHLLPEVYSNGGAGIGIFILGGFFLQLLLEIFSEGIEHGHIHVHKHDHKHAFPLGVILGLCIHSFLEGMPLVQHFTDANTQRSLLAGIILHHIPVALALTSMLLASHISKPATLFYLLLFASMAPLGAGASLLLSEYTTGDLSLFFDRAMAVVIGIFLHISTTILFESYEEHRFNLYKLGIMLLGAAIALMS